MGATQQMLGLQHAKNALLEIREGNEIQGETIAEEGASLRTTIR